MAENLLAVLGWIFEIQGRFIAVTFLLPLLLDFMLLKSHASLS